MYIIILTAFFENLKLGYPTLACFLRMYSIEK